MGYTLRLLLVEDSPDDAELLFRELRRGGYDLTVERVETGPDLIAALDRGVWDIVIADYSLPHFSALEALALVRQRGADLPFIVASGTIGEDTAVGAMKAGAHDFIVKGNLARLVPAIARELHEARERHARRSAELALRDRERRFRSLIEHASDIIALLAPDGTVHYTSPSIERVLGYAPRELAGQSILDYVHPEEVARVQELLRRAGAAPGPPVELEFRFRHRDSTWRVLDAVVNNQLDDPGVQAIVANARDITERTRTEERMQRQLARLAALRTIDMTITASLDLRVTFRVFLDQVTAHLHVDAAAVLLFDPHTQFLEYAASRGFRKETDTRAPVRLGEGCAGRVALERRTLRIPNLAHADDSLRPPILLAEEVVAYYGVPLIAKGHLKGVLEICHRAAIDPDPEWVDFLETLAGQAAIAIDNAMLFDELQHSNMELALAYDTTLEGWSRALDLRDRETEGHTQRVTEVTVRLARAMNISSHDLVHIRRGALLHDIGKMGIPDGILLKPGPLSEEEWAIMRRHPVYAYELLAPIPFLRPALDIPYCHHEKWDGTGYPRGLRAEQIPLAARIFAVVDVWDALHSDRPYRATWGEEQVRSHIRGLASSHFDPHVVEMFLQLAL
ncbi:MAG TPA: HD domain-containing phosphohydrolase [Chloroflexia bacterium]|nr:HD domain-containing phosphohydrolase [Chloroflexia bacterium]